MFCSLGHPACNPFMNIRHATTAVLDQVPAVYTGSMAMVGLRICRELWPCA